MREVRVMTDKASLFIYLFNIKGIIFGSKGRKMFQLLRIQRKMYKIKQKTIHLYNFFLVFLKRNLSSYKTFLRLLIQKKKKKQSETKIKALNVMDLFTFFQEKKNLTFQIPIRKS